MPIFKSKPNLPDNDKARIEFYLQQIAECIGFDRFALPVLSEDKLLPGGGANQTAEQIMGLVCNHLKYDAGGLSIETVFMPPEKSGGGG